MNNENAAVTGKGQRVDAIDGLRGIAILLVLICHFGLVRTDFDWLVSALVWAPHARLGVDVFFVLSGFLITRILLSSKGRSGYFSAFYQRRFLRIVPAYVTVLGLTGLGLLLLEPLTFAREFLPNLLKHLLFVQNWDLVIYGKNSFWHGMDHMWSLAIEEQFYLLWPLLLFLTPRQRLRQMCALLIGLSMGIKLLLWMQDVSYYRVYMLTFARMDGFAAGALMASLSVREARDLVPFARLCAASGLALLVLLCATHPAVELSTLFYSSALVNLVVSSTLLMVAAGMLPQPVRRMLEGRAICWMGFYSYGIYLLHYPLLGLFYEPLLRMAEQALPMSYGSLLAWSACYLLAFIGARLMYAWIERPALGLGHRSGVEMLAEPVHAPESKPALGAT